MADEARDPSPSTARTDRRREISLRRRDPKKRLLAYSVIGFALVVIAGFAVAAIMVKFVLPHKELVVRVDDVKYTRGDIVKLLQAKQKQVELLGGSFRSGREVFQALQDLIETEMIAQVAPRHGITVSEEEIDQSIRFLFIPRVGNAEVAPRQLEREFQDRYSSFLNELRLSKSDFRDQIRKQLLRERFRQFTGESVLDTAKQVRLHRIVLSPQDQLEIIRGKFEDLVDGRSDPESLRLSFKDLVREFSRDDREAVRQGGDLGWSPRGIYREYDDLIFELEVGQLSQQVPNFDNPQEIFFFMVSEVQGDRPLEPEDLDVLKTRALSEWLNEERPNHEVFAELNSDIYAWLIEQLKLTTTITPTPAPNPLGL